jgi:hypothetical protein
VGRSARKQKGRKQNIHVQSLHVSSMYPELKVRLECQMKMLDRYIREGKRVIKKKKE